MRPQLNKQRALLYFQDRLYVPDSLLLRKHVLDQAHRPPDQGHCGRFITGKRIRQHFWWPGLDRDVKQYVKTCELCQRMKPRHHNPCGLFTPLPTPRRPSEHVAIDFVTRLPRTPAGNDMIVVIVDRLTKYAKFVASKMTLKTPEFVRIFEHELRHPHGIPWAVISDRDV